MARTYKARPAAFRFYAPDARKVNLAGTFNNWSSERLSAKRDSRGNWTVNVDLKPGRYEYKFIVDGSWINDPSCKTYSSNPFGSQNCVIEVK